MTIPKKRNWTQEQVRQDFTVDEHNNLVWNSGPRKGSLAGWSDPKGYVLVRYKEALVRAHNILWLYHYGVWPDFTIDHINNKPWDNRLSNLRKSTIAENMANQRLQSRREGKFKGVHKDKDKKNYYVKIKKHGQQQYVGSYTSELEAAMAYNIEAEKLFGKFAKFNKVFEDHPDAEKEFVV